MRSWRGIPSPFGQRRQTGEGPAAPANTAAPVVTGVGYVGQTLTATPGTWTGSPTFAYQWQRGGVNIAGATSSTYAVTLADEGVPVRCVVTATNAGGSASANSNAIEQWVPSDLASVMAAWHDAYTASTLTLNGSLVTAIADRTANGLDFTQSDVARQPTYAATGWGGVRPCLTSTGGKALARTSGVDTVSIMAMVRPAGTAGVIYGIGLALGTSANMNGASIVYGADGSVGGDWEGTTAWPGDWGRWLHEPPSGGFQNLRQSVWVREGGNLRLNGVDRPRASQSTVSTTWNGIAIFGRNSVANSGIAGDFAEGFGFNRALTLAEGQLFEGYLHHRWGEVESLPIDHPYKTQAPTP